LPADQVRGAVFGSFTMDSALDKLKQAIDLDLRGKLASKRLQLYGFTLENVRTSVTQQNGVLNFPDLQARFDGELLKAAASVQLTETNEPLAKIDVRNLNTDTLHKLAAARKIELPPIQRSAEGWQDALPCIK
jgi:hypothetical protein